MKVERKAVLEEAANRLDYRQGRPHPELQEVSDRLLAVLLEKLAGRPAPKPARD